MAAALSNLAKVTAMFVTLLVIWMLINNFVPAYLVPTPLDVVSALRDQTIELVNDTATTMFETLAGLLLPTAGSFFLAIAFYYSRPVESALMPYAIALKSVPIVAMAPLLVIWAGNGIAGKVIMAAIVSFFPLLIGFRDGLRSKPNELDNIARVWAVSRMRVLVNLDLPLSLPSALSSLKVAAPLSLVGAVVAEFSGANVGLGHLIIIAAYRADIALLFGGIVIVSLLGIFTFQIAQSIESVVLKKMRMSRAG